MDYKHKSGAQKRREKFDKERNAKKNQQTLHNLGFSVVEKEAEKSAQASSTVDDKSSNLIVTEPQQEVVDDLAIGSEYIQNTPSTSHATTSNKEDVSHTHNPNTTSIVQEENVPVPEKKECDFDIGLIESLNSTPAQVEEAVRRGPEALPNQFPDDALDQRLPVGIFHISLANGEKVERNWLVWSKSKKALFCFPCRLFSKLPEGKRSALSLPSGYAAERNWRKLHNRIPEHENSNVHKQCYVQWRTFEISLQKESSVDCLLLQNIKSEAVRWKQILRRILDVTLFLGERGLPFRGSNSVIGDPKNYNFLGILELISHYDPLLEEHMMKVKESQKIHKRLQVHYLSPTIQNEFIEYCGAHVVRAILKERELAKYYSLVVDGTPDSAHVEQTVFILRYVLLDEECHKYKIHERFLKFVDCNSKTGEAIADLIRVTLNNHNIPLEECLGQGYDNASNMSGIYKGVQSRILKENHLAIFSPCGCHTLNLCGVQAAECCPEVVTFFGVLQKLYNIFSSSPQRWAILKEHIGCSLHSMSQTRWSARVDCVRPFAAHIPGLRKSIDHLEKLNLSAEVKSDLNGIKTYLDSFECIVMGSTWFKSLTTINYRSTLLQAREATLDVEVKNIRSLIDELQQLRDQWDSIFQECRTVAKNIGIADNFAEKRRRGIKRFFDEEPSQEKGTIDLNAESEFKQNVFYVLLDCLIGNMTTRFEAVREMEGRFGFLWNYPTLTDEYLHSQALSFCKYYEADVSQDLLEEISHLKAIHEANLGPDSLPPIKLLNKLVEFKMEVLFPNICIALRIFCTIPVSVVEGERSFSHLAPIKNFLRSTMCQDRLTRLATLALESFLARKLDFDSIISYFANQKARKVFL